MSSVEYHRPWILSPFADLIKIMSSGPSEGVYTTRRYSGLGILFENPLNTHPPTYLQRGVPSTHFNFWWDPVCCLHVSAVFVTLSYARTGGGSLDSV